MKEIYRVLKPKKSAIIIIPQNCALTNTYEDFSITDPDKRKKHFGQSDHVRWYGLDFTKRLKSAGFYIKIHYFKEKENDINKMFYNEKSLFAIKNEKNEHYQQYIPTHCITKYNFNVHNIIYECIKV